MVLAPAAYAATQYNVPAPGDRTCFTAVSNGDGTTDVVSTVDFADPNLSDEEFLAWFDSWPSISVTSLGARWVVVGPSGKTLNASGAITDSCAGIDNVIELIFDGDQSSFEALTGSFDDNDFRASGIKAPTAGTDRDGTWSLPYKVPGGVGGQFDVTGAAGLLNWSSATLSDTDGAVLASTSTDLDIWLANNGPQTLSLKVLRQTRGTVSGPSSVKPNTTFLLRVQTQQAGDGAWIKLPYATVKIDRNTGSGWKYLKSLRTTSTGIYNTRVQQSSTTQYRFRYTGSGTTAAYTSKTFTIKRR